MNFEQIMEMAMGVMIALKAAQHITVGDSQDVDTPDVEVSYKGHHYVITSMTIEKRT